MLPKGAFRKILLSTYRQIALRMDATSPFSQVVGEVQSHICACSFHRQLALVKSAVRG